MPIHEIDSYFSTNKNLKNKGEIKIFLASKDGKQKRKKYENDRVSNRESERESEKEKKGKGVDTATFDSRHFLIFALLWCVLIFYKR